LFTKKPGDKFKRFVTFAALIFLSGVACGKAGKTSPQLPESPDTPEKPKDDVFSDGVTDSEKTSLLLPEIESKCDGKAEQLEKKMSIGNETRRLLVHVPPRADCSRKMPVLFVLHGGGGTADDAENVTPFKAVANREGFLVVYPDGVGKNWNDGRVNQDTGEPPSPANDVAFLKALASALSLSKSIDAKRIYATGHSNGAMMSLRLACEAPQVFAAVAANAGSLATPLAPACTLASVPPVSVLLMHGTADSFSPYEGGLTTKGKKGSLLGIEQTAALFVRRNACTSTSTEAAMPNVDTTDRTTSSFVRSSPCKGSSQVVRVKVSGGGHTWPGNKGSRFPLLGTGALSMDFNASEYAWAFLKAHSR
jgi:polyhydroxybutyrate depolymerase